MAEVVSTAAEAGRAAIGPLDAERDLALRARLDGRIRVDRAETLARAKANGNGAWLGRWLGTHLGPGRLSLDEFLYYGLHARDATPEELARFTGKAVQTRLHARCNSREWFAVANDKLLLHHLMKGAALPHPELQAVYLRGADETAQDEPVLPTRERLRRFLEQKARYPLFAKPIQGMYSIGAVCLEGCRDGQLLRRAGSSVSFDAFADYVERIDERGYLFQDLLEPHPAWRERFGPTLPSARVMVLVGDDGPELHMATLKVPDGSHDADNFWREGNLLAAVDLDDGAIGRPVRGVADRREELAEHPLTGGAFDGFTLPDWDAARRLTLRAAGLVPGIRTQGWDVCFTDRGPVLLELNFGGDLNLHQLSHGRGVLSERYARHARAAGYRGKLPG